jgi:hypothetical protein
VAIAATAITAAQSVVTLAKNFRIVAPSPFFLQHQFLLADISSLAFGKAHGHATQ